MYMFPDEIINITEHNVKKHLINLQLYINDKCRIIPTNTMKLVGITLEGVNDNNKREAVIMDLTEENYKKIWQYGKELWDKGYISKYIICFLENNKCFRFCRPDQENFEVCRKMDSYMKDDDYLEIYNNAKNKFFLIGDSLNEILEFYKVEETKLNITNDNERSCEFEIN